MSNKLNYLVIKRKNSSEIEYFEYDKINGYDITPKTTFKDAIKVNKMILIEPTLVETVIKKKIEKRFAKLMQLVKLLMLSDDDTGTNFKEALNQIDKHRQELNNRYKKYLKEEETMLMENKLDILERQTKMQMVYLMNEPKVYQEEIVEENRRSR